MMLEIDHAVLFSFISNFSFFVENVLSCSSRTNRSGEDLPALLGCAEESLDEAPTLGGLQDRIPMY